MSRRDNHRNRRPATSKPRRAKSARVTKAARSPGTGLDRSTDDRDPEDPTQQLDDTGELYIEPLAVEAQPAAEALEDFDIASAENVEGPSEIEESAADEHRALVHDTGELYGVRVPHAGDTRLAAPEDRDAYEGSWRGESWCEALEEHAATMGPVPEEEIVIVDDSDVEHPHHRGHHPTQWRDRPVADKGSGGSGGL